jgi:hypothetical protein
MKFASAILTLLFLGIGPAQAANTSPMSETEMLAYLVQCVGTTASGEPALPTEPSAGCTNLQNSSLALGWRKHDWPDRRIEEAEPLGHQASDAVLDDRFRIPLVLQSFDFGDTGRVFGQLDRGNGDGGDAVTIVNAAAWIFFTEDGGAGQQWFVGESCRNEPRREGAGRASWLVFAADVTSGKWTERLARLKQAKGPDECPSTFNDAYTRYRRDTIEVPFRFVRPDTPVLRSARQVDTIVSEHFGGRSVATSDHLERFYLGRGLGKYRWERWEDLTKTRRADAADVAESFARSGRCPNLAYSNAPGPNWKLVDCRTWTNLVQLTEPWSASKLQWPGDAFEVLEKR